MLIPLVAELSAELSVTMLAELPPAMLAET